MDKIMSTGNSKAAKPWRFFALALDISWFFWMWVILLNWNVFTFPPILLGAFGLFSPAFAEIILISRTHERGYALNGLQARYNALFSSLILGVVWALWHVPLFFMKGTFQHDQLRFATPGFWSYIFGPIIISVLFTWIYNNTNRSTLSAILFHFMINLTAELLPLTDQGRIYSTVLVTLLSLMVIVIWAPQR